jgi:hypothetical protein
LAAEDRFAGQPLELLEVFGLPAVCGLTLNVLEVCGLLNTGKLVEEVCGYEVKVSGL